MKITTLFLALLLLTGCSAMDFPQKQAVQGPQMDLAAQASPALQELASPLPSTAPSVTPNATATVGLQATIDALQRQMVAATQTHEANVVTLMARTAVVEDQAFQRDAWTATAAPTARWETATAEAFHQEMAIANLTEQAASMTQTEVYPTQVLAASQAATDAKYSDVKTMVWIVVMLLVGGAVFVLAFGFMSMARHGKLASSQAAPVSGSTEPDVFTFQATEERGGYPSGMMESIRATADQLRAVADGIRAGVTLSYENWTPSEKGFSRGEFSRFCISLVDTKMAQYNDTGNLTRGIHLTSAGEQFFSKF